MALTIPVVATRGPAEFAEHLRARTPGRPGPGTSMARLAAGENVVRGVANHQRLFRPRPRFLEDGLGPERIRLLGGKAIAPVHGNEEPAQPQRFDDGAGRIYRLIGEHRHLPAVSVVRRAKSLQGFFDSVVNVSMIQLVRTVISEEILQGLFHEGFVFGIAQGAPHQHRRPVAHIGGNHFVWQFRTLEMPQHGIDRVHQVKPGVNQRAVQIKDQQPNLLGFEFAIELDHKKVSRVSKFQG